MKTEIRNAVIKSVSIDDADRGLLTAWLHLDYGGGGQSFGGICLYLPKSYADHDIMSAAGHFIWRCMEVGGVLKWQDLAGKTIRVKMSASKIMEIGHIIEDDWFCPEDDFKNLEGER